MNNITDIIKEMATRIAEISYKMGVDGVDKYMASVKIDAIIDECFKDLDISFERSETNNVADMMDKIAKDPSRFINGVTIKDRYPRVVDREAFTIIKSIPIDSTEERVYGVMFQDGKCIYVTGKRYLGGNYVSAKNYAEVEIPTWVRN